MFTSSPDYRQRTLELEITAGEERRDIELVLEGGAKIAGVVVDDTSQPVPGASVAMSRVRSLRGGKLQVQSFDEAGGVQADAAGYFEIVGLDRAEVTIRASAPGHASVIRSGVVAGAAPLRFELPRLSSVRGVVVDSKGQPVEGTTVDVGPLGSEILADRSEAGSTTGSDGGFELRDVRPGEVVLNARGRHVPTELPPITVGPGETVEGVRIKVSHGVVLMVSVVGPDGTPVPGATVRVRPESLGSAAASQPVSSVGDGDSGVIGRADANGVARITRLPTGSVEVVAESDGFVRSKPVDVVIPRIGEVQCLVTLLRGADVVLEIVDTAGDPVADAFFELQRIAVAAIREGRAGEDGRAVVSPLSAGSYRVRARAADPESAEWGAWIDLEVSAGKSNTCRVRVP